MRIVIPIIILSSIALFLTFCLVYQSGQPKIVNSQVKYVAPIQQLVQYNETTQYIKDIQEISNRIANGHQYQINVYDCTEFSRDLVKALKNEGYNARCRSGLTNVDNVWQLHTWVVVNTTYGLIDIEATNGEILSAQQFKEQYQVSKQWDTGVCR